MGGLVYLEGSHAIGVEMEARVHAQCLDLTPEERISAYNKNMTEGGWVSKDLPDMAERFDTRWLIADYEAGDVVLHSPYMIHASTTNESREEPHPAVDRYPLPECRGRDRRPLEQPLEPRRHAR